MLFFKDCPIFNFQTLGNSIFSGCPLLEQMIIQFINILNYYEKAYENGNKHVSSILGNIHQYCLGVEKNKDKAKNYFRINKKKNYWCFLIPLC